MNYQKVTHTLQTWTVWDPRERFKMDTRFRMRVYDILLNFLLFTPLIVLHNQVRNIFISLSIFLNQVRIILRLFIVLQNKCDNVFTLFIVLNNLLRHVFMPFPFSKQLGWKCNHTSNRQKNVNLSS